MSSWEIVSRAASLLIAVVYLSLAILARGMPGLIIGLLMLFPLGLIWFPEQLGNAMGFIGRDSRVRFETPPFLVSFMGWFFLIGFPVLIAVLSR